MAVSADQTTKWPIFWVTARFGGPAIQELTFGRAGTTTEGHRLAMPKSRPPHCFGRFAPNLTMKHFAEPSPHLTSTNLQFSM